MDEYLEQVEEGCQLTTVEEIAQAVNQLLAGIQEEAASRWKENPLA